MESNSSFIKESHKNLEDIQWKFRKGGEIFSFSYKIMQVFFHKKS